MHRFYQVPPVKESEIVADEDFFEVDKQNAKQAQREYDAARKKLVNTSAKTFEKDFPLEERKSEDDIKKGWTPVSLEELDDAEFFIVEKPKSATPAKAEAPKAEAAKEPTKKSR